MVCTRMVVGKALQMGQIQEIFSNLGQQAMLTDLWDVREKEKSRMTPRFVGKQWKGVPSLDIVNTEEVGLGQVGGCKAEFCFVLM